MNRPSLYGTRTSVSLVLLYLCCCPHSYPKRDANHSAYSITYTEYTVQ